MLYRISVVPPPLGSSRVTISPVSSMIVRMHYFSSILICLPVIFLLKVGLDFTARFISKEEDKDVQREVFSRQVKCLHT